MVLPASTIWRDYVTDGVAGSGPNPPSKPDIRAWGANVETQPLWPGQRRTGAFNLSFTTFGDVVAFGGNSAGNTLARGLMIGGGDANEGGYGTIANLVGHSTWSQLTPLRNYGSLELALQATTATFQGSVTAGGNTITWLQGTTPDTFWIGKKCYFGEARYKVSNVVGNVVTVTNVDGSGVSWPSNTTDVFKFAIVYGTGTCNVAGTAVTRVTGDPFVIYYADPSFNFKINGGAVTATAMSANAATLSAGLGTLTNVAFEYWFDINDQLSTFRLQPTNADIENLSMYARYDGYWIESQYAGYGAYRTIRLSSGEVSAGVKRQQVNILANGRILLGGPLGRQAVDIDATLSTTVNYLNVGGGATGVTPSIRARGSDTNVNLGFDTQGSGNFNFTSGGFAATELQIFATGGSSWLGVTSSTTAAPIISANGAATDIDIRLAPKGAGRTWVGPWTTNADAPVNGYVLVKDTSGNVRKLATIA